MEKTLIEILKYDSDSMTDCRHCMYYNNKNCPDVECHEGVILKFCEELEGLKVVEKIDVEAFIDSNHNFATAKAHNKAIDMVIAKIKGGQNGNV